MGIFEIFLIGIGLAMDAFAVSLTEGLTLKRLKFNSIMKPALVFGIFQAFMPLLGWFIGGFVSHSMSAYANYIAFLLLTIVGGKMILEARKEEKDEEEERTEQDEPSSNIFMLGIATSIDALAIGFTFSLIPNFDITAAIAIIGTVTFAIAATGVYFGHKFGQMLGSKAEYLGGIILVIMGIKALF